MPQSKLFYFKSRMSDKDWERLQLLINLSDPETIERAWVCKEVSNFCKFVALPILQQLKVGEMPEKKIEKTIWIPRFTVHGSTNHDILYAFADYKKLTPTQIIQRYIVDRKLIEDEIDSISR